MKHTHFTKRKFLEGIGKPLLQELFTTTDSTGSVQTSTPSPDLPDKEYFDAVAKLAMNPEQLPDSIRCGLGGAEGIIELLSPEYVETHYVKDTFD